MYKLSTFRRIIANLKSTVNHRGTDELLYAQKFNICLKNYTWIKNKAIFPGQWAAGFPLMYILCRILNSGVYRNILEFGLGESSKLTSQIIQLRPETQIDIIESNQEWIDFYRSEINSTNVIIHRKNLIQSSVNNKNINVYQNLLDGIESKKYGLILIDGPLGSPAYSRHQIVDIFEANLLEKEYVIIIDDYNRPGEKQTATILMERMKAAGLEFYSGVYSGEKETLVLASAANKYFISLQ
ncbi:MAG TPA: hypothetical protein PK076_10970 [Saprospiraceae bacterium]|nr:hypothetical protein [Saprospiraceae bacterium]